MNEVNRTLFIPLYGKAKVSKQGIILHDPDAEQIWKAEGFPIHGKSASKWLAYNMAMRARVFDDWIEGMLSAHPEAVVLHIGCGLDSRARRVRQAYQTWIDCDFPEVISARRQYFEETGSYRMMALDASKSEQLETLPDGETAILILEGLSMYLSEEQLRLFFRTLKSKYVHLYALMDVYTGFGAKASKYKNPVHDVGVSQLYGYDRIEDIIRGLDLHPVREHSFTPEHLVAELKPVERGLFKVLFTGGMYRKIYRLYELSSS